jgi:hypothetical protein
MQPEVGCIQTRLLQIVPNVSTRLTAATRELRLPERLCPCRSSGLSALAVPSRLMERNEAGILQRLRALRKECVEPTVAERGGRIVNRPMTNVLRLSRRYFGQPRALSEEVREEARLVAVFNAGMKSCPAIWLGAT